MAFHVPSSTSPLLPSSSLPMPSSSAGTGAKATFKWSKWGSTINDREKEREGEAAQQERGGEE